MPRKGEDGKPVYDQEFFLALARLGKDTWNRWRAANPYIEEGSENYIAVTFEGVDFREPDNSVIDFSGFVFGDRASFHGCEFGDGPGLLRDQKSFRSGMAKFTGAVFGDRSNLSSATFGNYANLSGAILGDGVTFTGATFHDFANLSGVVFGDRADLSDATFGYLAKLSSAAFGDRADLSGTTFRDEANLSGAAFGDRACVTGVTFGRGARLSTATFGRGANLSGATFGPLANLSGANLARRADLSGATFGDEADLSGAIFGQRIKLIGATFGVRTNLSGATYGDGANLSGATFGDWANLSGATFGRWANLSGATFGDEANLAGTTFGNRANLSRATFGNRARFNGWSADELLDYRSKIINQSEHFMNWTEDHKQRFLSIPENSAKSNAGPDTFLQVSFRRARFNGRVDFSGRKFKGEAFFTQVRFNRPPRFAGCDGFDRIDFTGARVSFGETVSIPISKSWFAKGDFEMPAIGWTSDSNIAVQLRRLRKLVEDTKNHDFERDLYIEERKAERGILFVQYWREGWKALPRMLGHCLWIVVMAGYALLADYGRSFVRPAIALVASVPVFVWAYGSVLTAPNDPMRSDGFHRALRVFSIANAVPFVGALTLGSEVKLTLLCGDQPLAGSAAQNKPPAAPATQSVKPAAQSTQPMAQPATQSMLPTISENTRKCVPIPSARFQILVLAQSIFSALCFFFIGLALRNYFKMR